MRMKKNRISPIWIAHYETKGDNMTEAERITRAKKKEYLKRYYLAHREAIRERQAKYYQNNKEVLKRASKAYYKHKCKERVNDNII